MRSRMGTIEGDAAPKLRLVWKSAKGDHVCCVCSQSAPKYSYWWRLPTARTKASQSRKFGTAINLLDMQKLVADKEVNTSISGRECRFVKG